MVLVGFIWDAKPHRGGPRAGKTIRHHCLRRKCRRDEVLPQQATVGWGGVTDLRSLGDAPQGQLLQNPPVWKGPIVRNIVAVGSGHGPMHNGEWGTENS